MFIVRGDAFPCAGGSLSHLGIALANHGARARQPAYYWVIGYPMTGIAVEDNAVVNNVVEVLYEVVAPKTGRSSTLNGVTTPLHCTPQMSNKPTLGFNIAFAQNQLKRCQFN